MSFIRRCFALAVLPAVLFLPSLPGARAADPAPVRDGAFVGDTFVESFDVTVANVEVFVTDRDGRPVPGLTRDDFRLWEDGRPAEITHFLAENVDTRTPGAGGEGADAASPPAAADPGGAAQGRTMAWFFNNLHLDPVSRIPVFAGIAKTLDTLSPRDRVVFFTYDRSTAMQMFPASDRPAIDRALEKIRTRIPGGFEMRAQEDELGRRMRHAADPVHRQTAAADSALNAFALEVEYKRALEALEAATAALAGLPGPKAMAYITGNLPLPQSTGSAIRNYLDKATTVANANRVTLYGLGVPSRGNAFQKTQGVIYMADKTGGLAYISPYDPAVLFSRMKSDLSTYYSLGYVPSKKAGAAHRIEVRVVDRPGLEVRYRRMAKAKSGDEEARDRAVTALYLGETANRLEIEAEVGAAQPAPKGMLKVDLTIRVPFARLALLPEDQARKGRIRLYLASRTSRDEISDLTQVVLPLRIPEAQLDAALADKVTYTAQLLLRPEPGSVVVGVRDELGNTDSAIVVPFQPPGREGQKAARKEN